MSMLSLCVFYDLYGTVASAESHHMTKDCILVHLLTISGMNCFPNL